MANRVGTYEVDPVSRIEGHLGIKITSDGTGVTEADAHGNLWRGFENFLLGRNVNDAITFVQRICGVCPVPHGMTSTYAVDTVLGYSDGHITFATSGSKGVPKKAVSIRNLVLGAEFLMSSITHFYHLAAPSYIQGPAIPPWTPYFADSFYSNLSPAASMLSGGRAIPQLDSDGFSHDLWSTVIRSYVVALRIRRLTFEAAALFAGRMPMTSVLIGGGVTFSGTEDLTARADQYASILKEVGQFVIREYVPIALALSVLYPTWDNVHNGGLGYGAGTGRYLAWGGFPHPDTNALSFAGGVKEVSPVAGSVPNFVVNNKADVATYFLSPTNATGSVKLNLTEDIKHSRYAIATADTAAYTGTIAYPGDVARTKPDRSAGYSYMKAPRWGGQACEVGPMARMFVSGLFTDNTLLAVSLSSYYQQYAVKAAPLGGLYNSLDPAMILPDIAVALVKAGLANLKIGAAVYGNATGTAWAATDATTAFPTTSTGIVGAYTDPAAEIVGPIADHVINLKAGKSTMDRLRARALESLYLVQEILGLYTKPTVWGAADSWAGGWVSVLKAETGTGLDVDGSTWSNKTIPAGSNIQGWGGTEAPRGALMHQVTITAGKIVKYQCIVPTTWNGSPKDTAGNRGAIEEACIGVPFQDYAKNITGQGGATIAVQGGVEVLRVAQSFDPCIACAVH